MDIRTGIVEKIEDDRILVREDETGEIIEVMNHMNKQSPFKEV